MTYICQDISRKATNEKYYNILRWYRKPTVQIPSGKGLRGHRAKVIRTLLLTLIALCEHTVAAQDCFDIATQKGYQTEVDNSWRVGDNNLRDFMSWDGSDFAICDQSVAGSNEFPVTVLFCDGRKYIGNAQKSTADKSGREWPFGNEIVEQSSRCEEISPNVYWSIHENITKGTVYGTNIVVKHKSQILTKVSFIKPNF